MTHRDANFAGTTSNSTMARLAILALAAAAAAEPYTPCAGVAPKWCADWPTDNEPFYNCSGSSELTVDECSAWQDVYDDLGLKAGSVCKESRNDPCGCDGGGGHHQSVNYCRGGQIYSLGMSGNRGMNGTLSPSLAKLTGLRYLDLNNNALAGPIPDLTPLEHLETLDLGGNRIPNGHDGLTGSVPDWLGNMSQLVYLDLALNKLTGSIPGTIASMSKLRTLYLYDNQLRHQVPELPFERYRYCGIGNSKGEAGGRNVFCEPLPKGAKGCHEEGPVRTSGVAC